MEDREKSGQIELENITTDPNEVTDHVVFDRFPLPPTSNHLYETGWNKTTGKSFRRKSCSYKSYIQECEFWRLKNLPLVRFTKNFFAEWIRIGATIKVDSYFEFSRGNIWTKKNAPKILDTSNRIKGLHDVLAHILQTDDRFFFAGLSEKVESCDDQSQCVIVVLKKQNPRTGNQIREEIRKDL